MPAKREPSDAQSKANQASSKAAQEPGAAALPLQSAAASAGRQTRKSPSGAEQPALAAAATPVAAPRRSMQHAKATAASDDCSVTLHAGWAVLLHCTSTLQEAEQWVLHTLMCVSKSMQAVLRQHHTAGIRLTVPPLPDWQARCMRSSGKCEDEEARRATHVAASITKLQQLSAWLQHNSGAVSSLQLDVHLPLAAQQVASAGTSSRETQNQQLVDVLAGLLQEHSTLLQHLSIGDLDAGAADKLLPVLLGGLPRLQSLVLHTSTRNAPPPLLQRLELAPVSRSASASSSTSSAVASQLTRLEVVFSETRPFFSHKPASTSEDVSAAVMEQERAALSALSALPGLRHLRLCYHSSQCCSLVWPGLPGLTQLTLLSVTGMGPEDVVHLPPQLQELELHGNYSRRVSLVLDQLTALTRLTMPSMEVAKGDKYPAGLLALEAANLAHRGAAKVLAGLKQLRRLELTDACEGNKALRRLTQLHELRLAYTHAHLVSYDSCDWTAVAPFLKHLSIESMDSFKASSADGGGTMINLDDLGLLTALTSLEMDSLELETSQEGLTDSLSCLTWLQQLRLATVEYADTHFFRGVEDYSDDSDSDHFFSDDVCKGIWRLLEAVADLPSLCNLQLEDYPIFDAVGMLQSAAKLTCLSLKYCMVRDEGMARLVQGCTTLRELSLEGEEDVTDTTMAAVAKQLQQLTRLQLAGLPKVTDAGVGKLSALGQLQQLEVQECRLVTAAGRRKALGQPAPVA